MSEHDRPVEQPAVKTTIVGGRPPGPGKPVGPIPRGIEVLVKKAAVDPAFRRLLLETRDAAAREIDLALEPAEAMMLKAAPREQLEAIIARTKVPPNVRSAFLGRAAGVMLVALGAGTLGCDREEGGEVAGIGPDRPLVERVEPPPSQGVRPDRPQVIEHSPGIRPGPPPAKRVEPTDKEATESTSPAKPTAPTPTGIRPDRLPVTEGSRPDRPEPKPPSTGETATAEKPKPATETLTVPADWDEQDAFRAFARGLKHLSAKLLPKHTFTFQEGEDGKIHIAWKTQEYQLTVPSNKVGDTEVVDATGPAADGLILTVWINKEPDQAERPQTIDHNGHWKTDLKQVQLLPLKTYLKYNLDYGPKAEKKLLTTFSSPQVWYQFHTAPAPRGAGTKGSRPDRPAGGTFGSQPDRP